MRLHKRRSESEEKQLASSRAWSSSSGMEDTDDDCCLLTSTVCKVALERSMESVASNDDPSKRSVRFGECCVRSYSQVLGDHPCCSMGCPLELGWDYQTCQSRSVDDYEASKGRRCSSAELRLTPDERRSFLQEYSDVEVRRACRKLNRCKASTQRHVQRDFFASK